MNKTLIKSIGFINGKKVKLIELENSIGKVRIINLGCTIHSSLLKDINHNIVENKKLYKPLRFIEF